MRYQFGTSSDGWRSRRYLPYAFTEQGVAMLLSVFRSKRAVVVNIEIMRTFVALRRVIEKRDTLLYRLDELERRFEGSLSEYDAQLRQVFFTIRELVTPRAPRKHQVGFTPVDE